MIRVAIAGYLILATLTGPSLGCCGACQATPSHPVTVKDASQDPPSQSTCPCCCRNTEESTAYEIQYSGTNETPAPCRCHCHEDKSAAVALIAVDRSNDFLKRFFLDSQAKPDLTVLRHLWACENADIIAMPASAVRDIFETLHILRC